MTRTFPRATYNPRETPASYSRGYLADEFKGIQRSLTALVNAPSGQTVFNIATAPYNAVAGARDNVTRFNAACQDAKTVNGCVYVPNGQWNPIGGPCVIPLRVDVLGESLAGSIWDGQVYAVNHPLWINEDSSSGFFFQRFANLTLRGGTWGIETTTTGTPQNIMLENVEIDLGTMGAIHGTSAWESSQFRNFITYNTPKMMKFDSGAVNALEFFACHSLLTPTAFDFASPCTTEGLDSFGSHFEGGGIPGQATFTFNAARSVNFYGGYIEGTSSILQQETNSVDGVAYYGVHRTAASDGAGGFMPYTWDITRADSSKGMPQFFGPNSSSFHEDGPDRYFASGIMSPSGYFGNNNAVYTQRTKQHSHFTSQRTTYPVSGSIDLIRLTRGGTSTAVTDAHAITARITAQFYAVDGGSAEIVHSLEYRVFVRANSTGTLTAILSSVGPITVLNGTTFVVQAKAGATATELILEGVFTGMPALQVSALQWEWSDLSSATSATTYIQADLP